MGGTSQATASDVSPLALALEQGDLGIIPGVTVNSDGTVNLPGGFPWYVWAGLGLAAFLIVKGLLK